MDLGVFQILEVVQRFNHETGHCHIDIFALVRFGEELHLLVCRIDRIIGRQIYHHLSAQALDQITMLPVTGLFGQREIVLQI